jgi:hypothetical protein
MSVPACFLADYLWDGSHDCPEWPVGAFYGIVVVVAEAGWVTGPV